VLTAIAVQADGKIVAAGMSCMDQGREDPTDRRC
jgi:hypothetical protein